jgi:hypothetical protein
LIEPGHCLESTHKTESTPGSFCNSSDKGCGSVPGRAKAAEVEASGSFLTELGVEVGVFVKNGYFFSYGGRRGFYLSVSFPKKGDARQSIFSSVLI